MTIGTFIVFIGSLYSANLALAQEAVPGEFIVTYKSFNVSSKTLAKTSLNHNLSLKNSWSGLKMYHFKTRSKGDEKRVMAELKKNPSIQSVEPNYIVRAYSLYTKPSTTDSSFIESIDESWRSVAGTQESRLDGPIVAVIDSGLDTSHEVFKGSNKLWVNPGESGLDQEGNDKASNGKDDDGNGFIDDINGWNFIDNTNDVFDDDEIGHGTHVAGIVASSSGPLVERSDLESLPSVRVMALKFLNDKGSGTTANALSAIHYAIRNGARVLNNSWGGPNYSVALHQAVIYAYEKNAVFVAAAGNDGMNIDEKPIYPASLDVPNVISVGASHLGKNKEEEIISKRAVFSNYGLEMVHIFAPGVNIYSSQPHTLGNYTHLNGTSMAAPYVSALAALMLIKAPHFSGYQIKRDILSGGESFPELSRISQSGKRINFQATLLGTQSSEENFRLEYSPEFKSRNITSIEDIFINDIGTGCGMVKRLSKDKDTKKNTSIVVFLVLWPLILSLFYRKKTNRFLDQNLG